MHNITIEMLFCLYSLGSRSHTTAVKWLLKWMREEELLDPTSYLVTVRPVAVEGNGSISKKYVDFIPNWM